MSYDYNRDALVEEMVVKHCEFLNAYCEWEEREHPTWVHEVGGAGERGHRYRPSDFLPPDKGGSEWGRRNVLGTMAYDERLVISVEIWDGDEGGSQTLTGFFEAQLMGLYRHMDAPPGEVLRAEDVPWAASAGQWRYQGQELDGWKLTALIQEFDTMYTTVWANDKLTTPETAGLT